MSGFNEDRIRKHQKNKFTQTSNTIIDDPRLTLKAKGLFNYLWSKPDGWIYYREDILNHCKEGRTAILSGMRELEACGYLIRIPRMKNGLKRGYIFHLSDEPDFIKESIENTTVVDNQPMEDHGGRLSAPAVVDNLPLSNTNSTNTKSVADETSAKPTLEGDREGRALANQLVDDMVRMKPNLKVGDKRESFAKDFALAIRRDGRSYGEMNNILIWLQSGGRNAEFWKTVILSGRKLRDQFDKLELDMAKDGFRLESNGLTKDVLRDYLIKEFGKSKKVASYQKNGKIIKIGFVGEYYTFANYNTGELLDKKTADWLWSYMLDNYKDIFPKFHEILIKDEAA